MKKWITATAKTVIWLNKQGIKSNTCSKSLDADGSLVCPYAMEGYAFQHAKKAG